MLAPGSNGQFLQTQGASANPQWASASGSGTVNSGTSGQIAYYASKWGRRSQVRRRALGIDSHFGAITADTDGATITFNLATSDWHSVTLGGNRTLALSNPTVGQQFTLELIEDGTGSCTVTWFTTIKWAGGSAPTLTTTAAKADVFTFKCTSSGNYLGFVAGQNF